MRGLLKDGPAAGRTFEVGDPPIRRGIVVVDGGGFGEVAHRYHLSAVSATSAVYTDGGQVLWPPEAGPPVLRSAPTVEEPR